MDSLSHKLKNQARRRARTRSIINGNEAMPRLSVNISNHHVSAQLIDDSKQTTLVHSTTVGKKDLPANLSERAVWVGTDIAKKALAKKYHKVVFDRGSKLYHGRVSALADAARKAGLEI